MDYGAKVLGKKWVLQNFSRHEKSNSVLNWTDPHVEDYHWRWKLNLTLWPLRPNNTLELVESSSSESTSCQECEQEHGYCCFVCVSFSFFYFEIVRVVHRRWTQCQTARLDLCTNILQGKGTFSTSKNGRVVKIAKFLGPTTTIFAYLLSFFFFTKFEFGRVRQVMTQWRFSMNHKQTQSGQNSISGMTGSSEWLHKETTLKGVDLIGIVWK